MAKYDILYSLLGSNIDRNMPQGDPRLSGHTSGHYSVESPAVLVCFIWFVSSAVDILILSTMLQVFQFYF